jgi:hypothetical protein
MSLKEDLTGLLNKHSRENISNTPDYILATYLMACLDAFEHASLRRESFYNCRHRPGVSPSNGGEGHE